MGQKIIDNEIQIKFETQSSNWESIDLLSQITITINNFQLFQKIDNYLLSTNEITLNKLIEEWKTETKQVNNFKFFNQFSYIALLYSLMVVDVQYKDEKFQPNEIEWFCSDDKTFINHMRNSIAHNRYFCNSTNHNWRFTDRRSEKATKLNFFIEFTSDELLKFCYSYTLHLIERK